jgi:methionine aminopeptidase
MSIQNFGNKFDLAKLIEARNLAKDIAYELRSYIRPGMTEAHAHEIYKGLCEKHCIQKQWHPAKLRFGPNTLLNFKDKSQDYILKENDIFFLDIGPVINDHEADFGETFFIGTSSGHEKICLAQKQVFDEVKNFWMKTHKTGEALYDFAKTVAQNYGFDLNMDQDGHRIGDFPHQIHYKGSLKEVSESIVPNAWILEIHLWDRDRKFGAFFEDLLTDEPLT